MGPGQHWFSAHLCPDWSSRWSWEGSSELGLTDGKLRHRGQTGGPQPQLPGDTRVSRAESPLLLLTGHKMTPPHKKLRKATADRAHRASGPAGSLPEFTGGTLHPGSLHAAHPHPEDTAPHKAWSLSMTTPRC